MTAWIDLVAVGKILLFGLIVGASVPTLFALGVRLRLAGADGRRVLVGLSWVIFAVVLLVVIVGVLFIARDFVGHHTGLHLFGSRPPGG